MKTELITIDKKRVLKELAKYPNKKWYESEIPLLLAQATVAHQHKFTTVTKVENNPAIRRCECGYKEEVEPNKASENWCSCGYCKCNELFKEV